MIIPVEYILYKDQQNHLAGNASGNWSNQGVAFSAGTFQFYGSQIPTVKYARWVVAWNPSSGPSPVGIRLCTADSGPSNIIPVAQFLVANHNTPKVDAIDITSILNDLCKDNLNKTIFMQTVGNGISGCKIYSSVIECWLDYSGG